MIIEYSEMCCDTTLLIGGVRFDELSKENKQQIMHEVVDALFAQGISDHGELYDLLCTLKPTTSDFDDKPCEQCGHTNFYERWVI